MKSCVYRSVTHNEMFENFILFSEFEERFQDFEKKVTYFYLFI